MKNLFTLLVALVAIAETARADVEWTIWEGSTTQGNVSYSKLDFATLEAGDIIYVYGSGTLSKTIYRLSGENWGTWTELSTYSPAVDDGDNYYHVITSEFLTNFNYSSDDTKGWAIGNTASGTITKVTIKKGTSMIKTTLSSESKSADTFEYTIAKNDFSKMVVGDFLRVAASKRDAVDGKSYKVEFKEAEDDWTTYTTLWGPTHDALYQITSSTIEAGIKDHPLYVYGELYNAEGVYLYHPISSFSIGSIGYATFSASQQVTAPAGVKAYKATVDGSTVKLTRFTNDVIPANTGAIIAGDEGAVLEFTASSESTSETSDLIACTTATDVSDLASGYDYYILYNNPTGGNTYFGLGDDDLTDDWGATYSSKTITYSGSWKGRGWWIGTGDYSDYSKLVVEFGTSTTIEGSVVINYNTDSQYTEQSFDTGVSKVEVTLDPSYKNSVKEIIIKNKTTTGSLTLSSAYLVSNAGSQLAEFRKTTSGTLAANKAYLKIAKGGSSRLGIVFGNDNEPTGISTVSENWQQPNDRIYSLSGQKVKSVSKGLYIKNGKKYVVK